MADQNAGASAAVNGKESRFSWSRFLKYSVLLVAVAILLQITFDSFSFYVARRDLDTELKSRRISSLEYISVLSQRERALALTSLEGRCLERAQLTMFRILEVEHDRIQQVYRELIEKKNAIIETIRRTKPGLIDQARAAKYIDGNTFELPKLDEYLAPLEGVDKEGKEYQDFNKAIAAQVESYKAYILKNAQLRQDIEKLVKEKGFEDSKYWNMKNIIDLATRIDQVREERAKNKEKMGDVEDLVARYNVWIGALTGGVGQGAILDDVAYQFGKADTERLKNVNCQRFSEYYEAVTGKVAAADPMLRKSWNELTWLQALGAIPRSYRQFLLLYFQQAPQAQTLFVTLFLGALGALTLNILRLSRVGWWRDKREPLWGDIIVGPFLGALAAFGIFLVGSAGLLLATEGSNSQPPWAYFIGLLGFLSGLSYDEAFGRVRLIGEQMFSAGRDDAGVDARAEDRSLAEALKTKSASRVAALILKLGTRLTAESEFTLLVPSDDAMGQIPLTTWTKLESDSTEYDKWYARHHAAKRVTKQDLSANGSTNLQTDDGTYEMKIEQGGLTIGGIPVLIADVIWNKGVIHILSSELPGPAPTSVQQ